MAGESVVDICNNALTLLGQQNIESLDDASPEANACRIFWRPLRDEVLRSHPWNFATTRAKLSRLVDSPPFGFKYYFQLPADCLFVRNVEPEGYFEIEHRFLLSDSPELSIKYTSANDDTTTYDSILGVGLMYRMASSLGYPLTRSSSLTKEYYDLGEDKIAEAKSIDSIEGKRPDNRRKNWLSSHYGR